MAQQLPLTARATLSARNPTASSAGSLSSCSRIERDRGCTAFDRQPWETPQHVRVPLVVWRSAGSRLPNKGEIAAGWYYLKSNHGAGNVERIRYPLDANPMEGMTKPSSSPPRERVLSDEEIRTLWNGLPAALKRSVQVQRIIRLCLVTAQRVGEVAGMRRDELDLEAAIWSLPGSRTKNGAAHLVPLSDLAREIITEALAEAGEGAVFAFPCGKGALAPHAVARTIGRAQESDDERPLGRFGLAHWTAHDLRRTALTGMAKLGVV